MHFARCIRESGRPRCTWRPKARVRSLSDYTGWPGRRWPLSRCANSLVARRALKVSTLEMENRARPLSPSQGCSRANLCCIESARAGNYLQNKPLARHYIARYACAVTYWPRQSSMLRPHNISLARPQSQRDQKCARLSRDALGERGKK